MNSMIPDQNLSRINAKLGTKKRRHSLKSLKSCQESELTWCQENSHHDIRPIRQKIIMKAAPELTSSVQTPRSVKLCAIQPKILAPHAVAFLTFAANRLHLQHPAERDLKASSKRSWSALVTCQGNDSRPCWEGVFRKLWKRRVFLWKKSFSILFLRLFLHRAINPGILALKRAPGCHHSPRSVQWPPRRPGPEDVLTTKWSTRKDGSRSQYTFWFYLHSETSNHFPVLKTDIFSLKFETLRIFKIPKIQTFPLISKKFHGFFPGFIGEKAPQHLWFSASFPVALWHVLRSWNSPGPVNRDMVIQPMSPKNH